MDITTESAGREFSTAERRPLALVAAGLALLVLGGRFVFNIPPLGSALVGLGILLAIWGTIAGRWLIRGE